MDLYETTPGATVRGIAQDLGIERGRLRQWLTWYGTGRKTGVDGRPAPSPLRPRQSDGSPTSRRTQETAPGGDRASGGGERRASGSEKSSLARQREILQQAAKYFAGEMIW